MKNYFFHFDDNWSGLVKNAVSPILKLLKHFFYPEKDQGLKSVAGYFNY